ncbi:ATP-binding protein [Aestuariibacter sp. AA17]|uniref:histidine kinase n=1 Tax=Fluctibacter corallii TaxID=2984329 RepID=A0ABT3A3Y5_9ALTE|nr:MHYT domain-containing protein [Aestuariibacter sp. AA17]MCV2883376.1 ATP-binding protein [Aestuariibacter sp. AA17]
MVKQHVFSWQTDFAGALAASHDLGFLILSWIVASISGFCALNLMHFLKSEQHKAHSSFKWLGGVVLGIGIWATHFIGMLAYSLPIPAGFNLLLTLLSAMPTAMGAWFALYLCHGLASTYFTSGKYSHIYTPMISALSLTVGMGVMHIIGMYGYSVAAVIYTHLGGLIIAFSVSMFFAFLAFYTVFNRSHTLLSLPSAWREGISALLFGLSIVSLHYIAMHSVTIVPSNLFTSEGMTSDSLLHILVVVTCLLLVVFTLVVFFSRRTLMLSSMANDTLALIVDTMENMSDPIVLCDKNGQVRLLNQAYLTHILDQADASNHIGASIETLNAYILPKIALPEETTDYGGFLAQLKKGERCQVKTGDSRWWLLRQRATPSGFIVQIWTNITEQIDTQVMLINARNSMYESVSRLEEVEAELLETKKLASIGTLVTSVAHELNTPIGVAITSLSAIDGQIDEMKNLVNNGSVNRQELVSIFISLKEFEQMALRNVRRAAEMIDQFKYITAEKHTAQAHAFNLSAMLKDKMPLFINLIGHAGIQFKVDIDNDIILVNYEEVLFQVIKILLTNSIEHGLKYQPVGNITLSCLEEGQYVTLVYQDDGKGLDPAIADNIFDAFTTTKRAEGKVGLGLHIAHNFVRNKLNGTISLDKSCNTGTRFYIRLPKDIRHG